MTLSNETYGDSVDALLADDVEIAGSLIESNTRAGGGKFGSRVRLLHNEILCHSFDLNGENVDGQAWSFDGGVDAVCGTKSSGLAPAPPVPVTP